MKTIVAVSGGVDSVVLLHMLLQDLKNELVVAHFDHGIRPESDADARFVEALAASYGIPFEGRREELGAEASEAYARERRYHFLRDVARRHQANLATAHHADDVIETIAINLHRGTGWRGLSILDSPTIVRPLVDQTKRDIYTYALTHRLEWVEDETNATDAYLRNRLRSRINRLLLGTERKKLLGLWKQQKELKRMINQEVAVHLDSTKKQSRYFFTHIDECVAIELLRGLLRAGATRPQLERALHAIKTARANTVIDIGAGIKLRFNSTDFVAEIP